MRLTPMLAMHGHWHANEGVFLFILALIICLVILGWPSQSETK